MWHNRLRLEESPMPDPRNPLRRSRANRMIGGVCGGIAEWLGWDPTLVRVLYVIVSIFSIAFPGLLVYIILWVVMPEAEG
jgi:phage shock protein C